MNSLPGKSEQSFLKDKVEFESLNSPVKGIHADDVVEEEKKEESSEKGGQVLGRGTIFDTSGRNFRNREEVIVENVEEEEDEEGKAEG